MKKQRTKMNASEYAVYLLSRRDHGVAELQQKMKIKEYTSEEIVLAMEKCQDYGYLDDKRFARSQVRQHINKGHGERRIRQELNLKKVSADDIDAALEEESIDWFALARSAAEKKFSVFDSQDHKLYQKQVRYLQYRGFDFEQIKYALTPSED